MFCPDDIDDTIEVGDKDKTITWLEPTVMDLSGVVTLLSQSHASGDLFAPGNTQIEYMFTDPSGNSASCDFELSLELGKLLFNFNDT